MGFAFLNFIFSLVLQGQRRLSPQLPIKLRPVLSLTIAVLLGFSYQAEAVTVYGLTNTNGFIQFDSATPQNPTFAVDQIGGLIPNDDLIGIDFRPANGLLYAVGTGGGAGGSARVYTIDLLSGVAMQVSELNMSLNGSRFGFDFNPVPDRLRIVSNTDQNLRTNVDTGVTLKDTNLNYQAGDLFFGQNPNVIASAYTNSFLPSPRTSPGTQLYGIDSVRNTLVLQVNPNGGVLQTVGTLGVDVSQLAGFDIFFDPVTQTNIGYAALQNIAEGVSRFYTIDLSTGLANPIGIDLGDLVDGIAVAPSSVPESGNTLALLALAIGGICLVQRRLCAGPAAFSVISGHKENRNRRSSL